MHLSEADKLIVVVDYNGFKDARESFSVFIIENGYGTHTATLVLLEIQNARHVSISFSNRETALTLVRHAYDSI